MPVPSEKGRKKEERREKTEVVNVVRDREGNLLGERQGLLQRQDVARK